MKNADELTKQRFCKILGAEVWKYKDNPSKFFEIWEDYQRQKERAYPWDRCRYEGQKEAARMMCKFIHKLYKEVSGLNVVQLEIVWN